MDQARLLGLMERTAHHLRRLGLGGPVTAVRKRLERNFVPSWMDVDGLQMTGKTIGHVAHLRAWQDGREEAHMTTVFKQAVKPGDIVLDVGGYLGYFTLLAARAAGPGGHVTVVEANPQSVDLLERNIERNGFGERVTIQRTAVADKPGRATFWWDDSDGSTSGLTRPDNAGGSYEVTLARIDDLLTDGPAPTVVKMDIEGGEVGALRGMPETLRGVDRLFVELNPDALANAGASGDALVALLRDAGFAIQVIDEAARTLRPLGDGHDTHANLYCTRA